jgi:hypothetical protein
MERQWRGGGGGISKVNELICVCMYVCVCVYVCIYISVLLKTGGSSTYSKL